MSFQRIVVATDFSECAECAVNLAVEVAQKFNATLTLVHCWEAPTYAYGGGLYTSVDAITPIERAASRCLEDSLAALKLRVPAAASMLRSGPAWEEILLAAAETHADLIVVGTHGRQGLTRALLGSVAERVVRMAKLPVLSVHDTRKPHALDPIKEAQ